MDFSSRSYTKELLDRDDIPFEDIELNMKELDIINTYLGGHSITIDGLKQIIGGGAHKGKIITVAEIGCGGGDNLREINQTVRPIQSCHNTSLL